MKENELDKTNWSVWCEKLWQKSGNQWIKRTGQDHYYRDRVVVPALLNAIGEQEIKTLIDVGSGDGYTTNLLLKELEKKEHLPDTIILIDRSSEQLQKTRDVPLLREAKTIVSDISVEDWSKIVLKTEPPRLFLSTFVYQEIPKISFLFKTIAGAMNPGDLCLSVIVNPEYSTLLKSQGKVKFVSDSVSEDDDWDWVGKYPIGIEDGTIYLPHFERKIETYGALAEDNGLIMQDPVFCGVPDTKQSREVFGDTVYGYEIIGVDSSILLSFTKE